MALSEADSVKELLKDCPEFQKCWADFMDLNKRKGLVLNFFTDSSLSRFIRNSCATGDTAFFSRFFAFIERMIVEGDKKAAALAAEGFLPALHKACCISIKPGHKAFTAWMLPRTLSHWEKLSELKAGLDRQKDAEEEEARATAIVFRLRQAKLWGDYGTFLMRGTAIRDKETGNLLITRAGPFAPPIFLPLVAPFSYSVVVTDSFRKVLENSGLGTFTFRPTVKTHIYKIPWHTWDRLALPLSEIPKSGEPEDFATETEHSEEASEEMGELWELLAPQIPCEVERADKSYASRTAIKRFVIRPAADIYRGLFSPANNPKLWLVDEPGRLWLEQHAGEWVQFDYVIRDSRLAK